MIGESFGGLLYGIGQPSCHKLAFEVELDPISIFTWYQSEVNFCLDSPFTLLGVKGVLEWVKNLVSLHELGQSSIFTISITCFHLISLYEFGITTFDSSLLFCFSYRFVQVLLCWQILSFGVYCSHLWRVKILSSPWWVHLHLVQVFRNDIEASFHVKSSL